MSGGEAISRRQLVRDDGLLALRQLSQQALPIEQARDLQRGLPRSCTSLPATSLTPRSRRQINVLRSLLDGMSVVMRCRDGWTSTFVGRIAMRARARCSGRRALPVLRLAMVPELPFVASFEWRC
jgi:hypothetical protein